jgi:hypothetical protein
VIDRTEPTIGWFMLSESDRTAACRYLAKLSSDDTRDELGFAPIHFAFADRFFPGTSVQCWRSIACDGGSNLGSNG